MCKTEHGNINPFDSKSVEVKLLIFSGIVAFNYLNWEVKVFKQANVLESHYFMWREGNVCVDKPICSKALLLKLIVG